MRITAHMMYLTYHVLTQQQYHSKWLYASIALTNPQSPPQLLAALICCGSGRCQRSTPRADALGATNNVAFFGVAR